MMPYPWSISNAETLFEGAIGEDEIRDVLLWNISCEDPVLTELIELLNQKCPQEEGFKHLGLFYFQYPLENLDLSTWSRLATHCKNLVTLEVEGMFYLNESCKLVLSEWLIQVFHSDPPLELLKLRSYS